MPRIDPLPALSRLVRHAIGDKLTAKDGFFSDMCAADVVFQAPYAPGGGMTLNGRAAVEEYLPKVPLEYQMDEFELTDKYEAPDSDVVVIEFFAHGRGTKTQRPYRQKYINVFKIKNGEIVRYADYWNPLIALWTTGKENISAALAGEG